MSDEELKQLVHSNAKAVQVMLDAVAKDRLKRFERNKQFDEMIQRLDEYIARLKVLDENLRNRRQF